MILIEKCLCFFVYICFWQKRQRSKRVKDSDEKKEMAPTNVRSHFRRLLAGAQPSKEALEASLQEFGIVPPEGKTFIMGHDRAGIDPERLQQMIDDFISMPTMFTLSLEELIGEVEIQA